MKTYEFEYTIKSISKSQLAEEQGCCVKTIYRRFKKLGIDTGFKKLLEVRELKSFYESYGKPIVIQNAG